MITSSLISVKQFNPNCDMLDGFRKEECEFNKENAVSAGGSVILFRALFFNMISLDRVSQECPGGPGWCWVECWPSSCWWCSGCCVPTGQSLQSRRQTVLREKQDPRHPLQTRDKWSKRQQYTSSILLTRADTSHSWAPSQSILLSTLPPDTTSTIL